MASLSATERRSLIAQMVVKEGRVWTVELQRQFNVDQTSIWRDLRMLEGAGQLRRVHGGATTLTGNSRVESFAEKMQLHLKEKERIGKAAAEMIGPRSVCIFDSGTTTLQIVKQIPAELRQAAHPITLVTNSIPITQELLNWPLPNLNLLGGIFLPEYQASVGPQTLHQLRELTADLVFLGTDGITLEGGVTTANILMAEVDRLMVERSRRAVLVTDSSKLGRVGFVPVTSVTSFQCLITDTDAPANLVDAIRDQGVEVVLV
jgi:DeoR/GlpR family transcriptional regulator of sugar metabolism